MINRRFKKNPSWSQSTMFFSLLMWIMACSDPVTEPEVVRTPLEFRAADLSFLPEVRKSGAVIFNRDGVPQDMLTQVKNEGLNVARLRVWNAPAGPHSTLSEVVQLAKEMREKDIKVWITLHYSDWWADPGKQTKPSKWRNLPLAALKDSVYQFTKKVMLATQADYIQIGNEINQGLLWPEGHITKPMQMKELLKEGIRAVRETDPTTKIMLHFAGHENANEFFTPLTDLDFDLIGISYYPFWHGKDINLLQKNLAKLYETQKKRIVIAETAYPFTLLWNDQTTNVIGENAQIHPDYPATPKGQLDFLLKVKEIILASPGGAGFCYWAPDWISLYGNDAKNGSSWENQSLWGFDNKATQAIKIFN